MKSGFLLALLLVLESTGSAATVGGESPSKIFGAIRNGDAASVRILATQNVNIANAEGETPLMYAAIYSDASTLKLLLGRGADVNAKTPAGTTALMLATGDLEKVRALVERGAQVNAASATGRTPLIMAASRSGSTPVVKYLLAHGANPNAKDKLEGMPVLPAGAGGSTALIEAAKIRELGSVSALLDAGADITAKDNAGADALSQAVLADNIEIVRLLLSRGANVSTKISVAQFSLLHMAAWRQDPELARLLIANKADVNARDAAGSTPLMWSAYSDYAETETTKVLLNAGADVNVRNARGQSALTWAMQRGETPMVKLLFERGAKPEPRPSELPETKHAPASLAKTIALLQNSGPQFAKVSGCISCHNQSLPQIVVGMAKQRGIAVDEKIAMQTSKTVMANIRPARLPLIEMADVVPDLPATAAYVMLGMHADGYEPDASTDALVMNVAAKQFPDGSWRPWGFRPPMEFSAVSATALSVRMLQLYEPPARHAEFAKRIQAAREFLRTVQAKTNEERAMRLLGLKWAGARDSEVTAAADAVIATQRADGGWGQLAGLGSDAYATGQSLYALRTAGGTGSSELVYRRGAEYLRSTQLEDGSWRVATRSFPVQPYKESGFPHGNHQWISSAGTSWAAMALMLGE